MIIKKSAIFFILFFVMSLPVWAIETTGNINLIAGKKNWSDDWDPISKMQDEFGVSFDIKEKSWPVCIAIETFGSSGDRSEYFLSQGNNVFRKIKVETGEFCLGLKKIIDIPKIPVKPFFGAGFAYAYAETNVKYESYSYSVDDSTLGLWMSGGIYITLFERINAGVIARMSWAEVDHNKKFDVGGEHYGIFIGYHW